MKVQQWMIPVYALLVRTDKRTIESLPEVYQIPVADHMAEQVEAV